MQDSFLKGFDAQKRMNEHGRNQVIRQQGDRVTRDGAGNMHSRLRIDNSCPLPRNGDGGAGWKYFSRSGRGIKVTFFNFPRNE
jgi:hypothetical protein